MNAKDYPVWDWEKHGKVLQGTYLGMFTNVGKWRHTLFVIKQDGKNGRPGKSWKVWETKHIREALSLAPVGTKVRFEYRGLVQSEKNKTHKVKDFKVNISRTGKELDLRPRVDRKIVAGRHGGAQRQARPLAARAAPMPSVPATKKIIKKKIIKKDHKHKLVDGPPEGIVQLAPPPVPPQDYGSREAFLEGWKKKLRKI